ncbi:MAG: hypothetical protein KJ070_12820 [Verrucomicrobia bacterium]|nr:hypothetical protein [Verrucomicrobiota bacterium]
MNELDTPTTEQRKPWYCPSTRSAEGFCMHGWINDETARVKAQIVDGGVANELAGLVERNGTFWVEDLPLASGTNLMTLVAEDAAGNLSSTNLSIVKSTVTLTITSTPEGESLYEPFGTVAGTVSDPDYEVTVHGVAATGANPSSRVTRIVSVFRPRRASRAPPRFVGRHAWRRRVADARPGGHALFR